MYISQIVSIVDRTPLRSTGGFHTAVREVICVRRRSLYVYTGSVYYLYIYARARWFVPPWPRATPFEVIVIPGDVQYKQSFGWLGAHLSFHLPQLAPKSTEQPK